MTKQDTVKIVKLLAVVFATFLVLQVFLTSVTASGDFWVTKKSLPTGQTGTAVGASNGMIYVISDGVNEMYNPTTDMWTSKTPMPTNRTSFSVVAYENKIYVLGGFGEHFRLEGSLIGGSTTDINEVYDIETDTWETKTSMPTFRGDFSANAVNGKIYVLGGYKNGMGLADIGYRFDVNYVYDIATDTWSNKTSPPQNVDVYRSVVIDNKIHLLRAGPSVFRPISNAVESQHLIYDTVADIWSYGALMPTPVISDPAIGAVGATTGELAPKRIYVIGGGPKGTLVQVYDPETDTWSTGTSMPTSRSGFSIAVVDDCLYVIGGFDSADQISAANEIYIPLGHNTATLPSNPNAPPENTRSSTDIIYAVAVVVVVIVVVSAIVINAKKRKN
jgi:N-acetylneuraminic acid mutarotase